MNYILNNYFPIGLKRPSSVKDLNESTDILLKLLESCPEYKPTDLYNQKILAKNLGLNSVIIKDERKNKVLSKKINSKISVTMVHGQKDEVVPVSYSRKVLKIFQKAKKKLVIIKNGDHSLSSQKWLKIITKELKLII